MNSIRPAASAVRFGRINFDTQQIQDNFGHNGASTLRDAQQDAAYYNRTFTALGHQGLDVFVSATRDGRTPKLTMNLLDTRQEQKPTVVNAGSYDELVAKAVAYLGNQIQSV